MTHISDRLESAIKDAKKAGRILSTVSLDNSPCYLHKIQPLHQAHDSLQRSLSEVFEVLTVVAIAEYQGRIRAEVRRAK